MKEKYQHKHSLFIFLSINCINEQIRGMLLKRVKMGKRIGRAFAGTVLGIALVVGHIGQSVIYSVAVTDGTATDTLNLFIDNASLRDKYDFIFIDCPPTQSVYTTSAFKASDFYLLIIKPDYLSTIGLSLFEKIVGKFNNRRTKNAKIQRLGIIANLVQKGSGGYHDEKLREIREKYKFSKVFEQTIIINNRIARASEEQKLMYETKGCKSPILKLTREFLDVYNCAVNGGSLNDR